jgi:hypothetical protein
LNLTDFVKKEGGRGKERRGEERQRETKREREP